MAFKPLVRPFVLAAVLYGVVCAGAFPTPEQQAPPRRELTPDEIIRAFTTKETEFQEAFKQYTYRQTAEIKIVSVNGRPARERMVLVSEVVFDDQGRRDIRIISERGELRSVGWTKEDYDVIHNLQPFALTTKDLPQYEVKYDNKERIDELNCYVFSVKPKSTKGVPLGHYFQGRIYVDDQDLQIVRTVGKAVPQKSENQFPEFETIRQVIDGKYWFPTWTHADSQLHFGSNDYDRWGRPRMFGNTIRVEETITYADYKQFGAKATIQFGPVAGEKPPEKPEKPEKKPDKP